MSPINNHHHYTRSNSSCHPQFFPRAFSAIFNMLMCGENIGTTMESSSASVPPVTQVGKRPLSMIPRSVRFSTVQVQEYPYIMGDSPAVSHGPPLSIGWTPTAKYIFKQDSFEANKERDGRRSKMQFTLDARTRYRILREGGWTSLEIINASRAAKELRDKRRDSALRGPARLGMLARKAAKKLASARLPKLSMTGPKDKDELELSSGSGSTSSSVLSQDDLELDMGQLPSYVTVSPVE